MKKGDEGGFLKPQRMLGSHFLYGYTVTKFKSYFYALGDLCGESLGNFLLNDHPVLAIDLPEQDRHFVLRGSDHLLPHVIGLNG